jgi:hypothetical protein
MLIEGSGSERNNDGSGSGRPKNIRIHNTAGNQLPTFYNSTKSLKTLLADWQWDCGPPHANLLKLVRNCMRYSIKLLCNVTVSTVQFFTSFPFVGYSELKILLPLLLKNNLPVETDSRVQAGKRTRACLTASRRAIHRETIFTACALLSII